MKIPHFILLVSIPFLSSFLSPVHAAPSSAGYSEAQVDGITSRIVDNLWSRTDYWWGNGDYPRIIQEDRVITEADPHFLEPYATGGWLMESDRDYVSAEKYYLLGATRNPDRSYIWYNLGFFYYNTLKNYPKAVATFETDVKIPDADINDWKMLAHSYERNNQLDKAVTIWQKLNVQYANDGVVIRNMQEDEAKLEAVSKSQETHS